MARAPPMQNNRIDVRAMTREELLEPKRSVDGRTLLKLPARLKKSR
jgi:hypothetical protein